MVNKREGKMKKFLLVGVLFLVLALTLIGCPKKNKEVVNIYNWSEYISEDIIDGFEKETGIKVNYSTYDSNEAMYSKLKLLDGKGYDLVFPATYFIEKMSSEGLLMPLDLTKIPNYKDIDAGLLDQPYDPKNEYSLPFMWCTTGIAVNTKYIDPTTITSWGDLWREEFKGKVLLQNSIREVFHMALNKLGYSGNSQNEKEIEAAYNELVKLAPSVRLYSSESPKIPFLNEEVYIGLMWGGEAYLASSENPDIVYILPSEGGIAAGDHFVIPAKAANVDNAHKFINYILQPEILAEISEKYGYTSPSSKSKEYLPIEVSESVIINPTIEQLKKVEFQRSVGEKIVVYEKFWEKLKILK